MQASHDPSRSISRATTWLVTCILMYLCLYLEDGVLQSFLFRGSGDWGQLHMWSSFWGVVLVAKWMDTRRRHEDTGHHRRCLCWWEGMLAPSGKKEDWKDLGRAFSWMELAVGSVKSQIFNLNPAFGFKYRNFGSDRNQKSWFRYSTPMVFVDLACRSGKGFLVQGLDLVTPFHTVLSIDSRCYDELKCRLWLGIRRLWGHFK
jgi:hypothetical protein